MNTVETNLEEQKPVGLDAEQEARREAEQEREEKRRRKRAKRKTVSRVVNRIFGFVMATVIVLGLGGLALEYVCLKGPSETLRNTFAMTMFETRRFTWIPNIFLTEEEVAEIRATRNQHVEEEFDASLITLATEEEDTNDSDGPQPDAYGLIDEDGDGIIIENIRGSGYVGYMLVVKDPHRVFVGAAVRGSGAGLTLEQMCEKYNAIGGINGGAYVDHNGGGTGDTPDGLTILSGQIANSGYGADAFVGLDTEGKLHVGYYTLADVQNMNITDGVSFGPVLIINGNVTDAAKIPSGVNPRTAIGQRADGAILMLVIDGRQVHSIGATYTDLARIMADYGAVNACNLDGGSSSSIYCYGEYLNSSSSANGVARALPDAFLIRALDDGTDAGVEVSAES